MSAVGEIKAGRAYVEIGGDDRKLEKALAGAHARLKAFSTAAAAVGQRMLTLGAVMAAPFAAVAKFGSDAEETRSKFNQLFGDMADTAGRFAEDLGRAVGRSKTEIMKGMSAYQAFFVGMGFGQRESLAMSEQLAKLSLDFASFHNITDQDAMERFIAALSGSSEVLDSFGVNIKEAAINQELLRSGFTGGAAKADEMQKAVARLAIITRAMTDQGAAGDAVRTAGSFANQLKRMQAQLMDAAEGLGTALIPQLTRLVSSVGNVLGVVARWVKANGELVAGWGGLALKLTGVTVGLGLLVTGVGRVVGVFSALTAAVRVLGPALSMLAANPTVAMFGALAVAVTAVGWALSEANERTAELTDNMSALTAKGDEARKLDQLRMERLQQLSDAQQLNNTETKEAEGLIKSLSDRYGDLGISVDATTGKITGLTAAQAKLNEKMREAATANVNAEIGERSRNIREIDLEAKRLEHEISELERRAKPDAQGRRYIQRDRGDRLDQLMRDRVVQQGYLDALRKRREAIGTGDADAITGGSEEEALRKRLAGQAPVPDKGDANALKEAEDAAKDLAKLDEQQAKKRRTDLENEIAEIRAVAAERRKLVEALIAGEKAKGSKADPKELERLQKELDPFGLRVAAAIKEAVKKAAEEAAKEAAKTEGERADFRRNLAAQQAAADEQAARERLDAATTEAEKAAAKAAVEAAQRRRAEVDAGNMEAEQSARARELFKDDPAALAEALAGIQALGERMRDVRAGADDVKERHSDTRGTFNARALASLQSGGAAERTAKATEAMKVDLAAAVKNGRDLLKVMQDNFGFGTYGS